MKRSVFCNSVLIIFFLYLPGFFIVSQAQDKNIVSFQVKHPASTMPGAPVTIEVVIDIASGWSIYAPVKVNRQERLQVTQLDITYMPEYFKKTGEDELPVSAYKNGHEVYVGNNNRFGIHLQTSTDVPSGEYQIEMELSYQACNNNECLPPVTEQVVATVSIGSKVLSARQILDTACYLAAQNNKKVLLMFHSSWCVWCHKMDSAINNEKCISIFNRYYEIAHIRVWEDKKSDYPENPGGSKMLKQYQETNSGIPFWLIFDTDGRLLTDSHIRLPGKKAENIGCPTTEEHVDYFLKVLKGTSGMNDQDLSVIRAVFLAIR